MKITKRQLRRIIKEEISRSILVENIQAIVKKYASAGKPIDDAISSALKDNPDIDKQALEDAMEDYYDEMMGF